MRGKNQQNYVFLRLQRGSTKPKGWLFESTIKINNIQQEKKKSQVNIIGSNNGGRNIDRMTEMKTTKPSVLML